MHLNRQVVQRIHPKPVTRRKNRRRTVFRNDGGAGKAISRDERRAIVYRRVVWSAVEEHRSMAGECLLSIAANDRPPDRIERLAAGDHPHANIDYFHLVLSLGKPVAHTV